MFSALPASGARREKHGRQPGGGLAGNLIPAIRAEEAQNHSLAPTSGGVWGGVKYAEILRPKAIQLLAKGATA